jgi:hypothetical protein
MVADFWAGGFTGVTDYHVIYKDTPGDALTLLSYNMLNEEQVIDETLETVRFRQEITASPYNLIDGTTAGEDTVFEQDHPPLLGIIPYQGAEGFWLTSTAKMFIDFNANNSQDFPKYISDSSLISYNSNGSNLLGRRTFTAQVGGRYIMAGADQPMRLIQQLRKNRLVYHQAALYERTGGEIVRGWNVEFPIFAPLLMSTMLDSMPVELRDLLLYDITGTNMWPVGSYSFLYGENQVFLQASDVTNTIKWGSSTIIQQYFDDHPEMEHWKLFITLSVGSNNYLIPSSQFISLLDLLADVPIINSESGNINWTNALRMLYQLFPYPNNNHTVPYDSVMFHAHNGNIYTWTRKYGSVVFDGSGIQSTSLQVPSEINNVGTRPDITYAGEFDDVHLYLCVCNKVKEKVTAVYYGSPFNTWTKLPGMPEGVILVHIRPVKVSPEEIFLIGVVKSFSDELDAEVYSFAFLQWIYNDLRPSDERLWKRLGVLPCPVGDRDNFQVGLFGNDRLVNELADYLSPPPILPQMPIGTYENYTLGMP